MTDSPAASSGGAATAAPKQLPHTASPVAPAAPQTTPPAPEPTAPAPQTRAARQLPPPVPTAAQLAASAAAVAVETAGEAASTAGSGAAGERTRKKITVEKAVATRAWTEEKYRAWGGVWPGESAEITRKLHSLGITEVQARRQLSHVRLAHGDVVSRGSAAILVTVVLNGMICTTGRGYSGVHWTRWACLGRRGSGRALLVHL